MSKVLVMVQHPNTRIDNTAGAAVSWRAVAQLKSAPAGSFQPVGDVQTVAAGEVDAQLEVDNVVDGAYFFGAIWTDSDGQDSDMAVTELVVSSGGPAPKPARLKPGTVVATQVA